MSPPPPPPPPPPQHGEATAGDPHRSIPTPFLTKTFQLVDDPAIDDVISWNDDGSSFVVWNPTVFARDLLPKYFKHNNFSSFVRQLNTYGFRKVVPDRWEFSNDFFRKGEKKLLLDIQRRKLSQAAAAATPAPAPAPAPVQPSPAIGAAAVVSPTLNPVSSSSNSGEEQVISGASSASVVGQSVGGPSTELFDENDRLRKENVQLTRELKDMKHLCNNIYSMVSNYSPGSSCQSPPQVTNPVDIPSVRQFFGEEAGSARLFGVAIGNKRGRMEGEGSTENGTQQAGGVGAITVKTEQYDCCEIMDVDSDDSDDRHSLTLKMATNR
ncbi:heat stress transcription factor B-2a [Euphorbia lathyris]|uniref:heat stress transcription factor B-2a n=1 Tax=Euphorbia lathyris TaxID=212925 RepID=UPI0033133E71